MWNIFHKGDMILLILCIVATIFGIVMISAVVGEEGSSRNMSIQIGTLIGGVILIYRLAVAVWYLPLTIYRLVA